MTPTQRGRHREARERNQAQTTPRPPDGSALLPEEKKHRKLKVRYVCERNHEHRFYFMALLCSRVFGDFKSV